MNGERSPDAVVVGAGIVGAAVAWYLARAGMRVLVLEAGAGIAGVATAGGMGHVVVMEDSPAQLALTARSRMLLAELAPELPADCEVDACGTLWIAEDEPQLDGARTKQALLEAHGIGTELLDAHQLAAAEPELRAGLAGALRVHDDLVIYPPAFARWLLDRAADHGARVRTGVRVRELADGRVVCDADVVHTPVIINAAGTAAPALTPGLAIIPRKGHLVITDRYPAFCRHQLVELGYLQSAHSMTAASVAFNLQPRLTGQVLIGSSRELVGNDARVNHDVLKQMLARALAFTPRLSELRALRTWTAFRPATPDKLPYIGRAPAQPNVWVAAGHEGLGITTALATGELVTDLVAGRAPALDAAAFSTTRTAAGATS